VRREWYGLAERPSTPFLPLLA